MKPIFGGLCASALFSATAFSGDLTAIVQPEATETDEGFDLPEFDIAKLNFFQTGEMDFDGGPGNLSVTEFGFSSFFIEPLELADGLIYLPLLSYYTTSLDFDNAGAFPLQDEDLHSASLHSFFIKSFRNSPWFALAWNRVEFATDYQDIGGDSVTFDAAIGVGYKVCDTFNISLGAAVTDINGDVQFIPGVNFDWQATEKLRVGLYGPNFIAAYAVRQGWNLSVRGEPTGGSWVFRDNNGRSRTIDLSSYVLGLYTENNIFGDVWLTAGTGYTLANEIERRGNSGGGGVSSDLDGAPFVEISLGLRSW